MISIFISNRITISQIYKIQHIRTIHLTPTHMAPRKWQTSDLPSPERLIACQLLESLHDNIISGGTKMMDWTKDYEKLMSLMVKTVKKQWLRQCS